jgi:septal ring factor EnvC (AmiA/AmiB activator)
MSDITEEEWNKLSIIQMINRIKNPDKMPSIKIDIEAVKYARRHYDNLQKKKSFREITEEYKGHFLSLAKEVYLEKLRDNATRAKVEEHEKKINIVERNIKKQDKKINKLQEEIGDSNHKIDDIKETIEKKDKKSDDIISVLDEHDDQLALIKVSQDEIKHHLFSLDSSVTQVITENAKIMDENIEIKERVNKLEHDLYSSKVDIDIYRTANESLSEDKELLLEDKEMLQAQIQKLQEKIEHNELETKTKLEENTLKMKRLEEENYLKMRRLEEENYLKMEKLKEEQVEANNKLRKTEIEVASLRERCENNEKIMRSVGSLSHTSF